MQICYNIIFIDTILSINYIVRIFKTDVLMSQDNLLHWAQDSFKDFTFMAGDIICFGLTADFIQMCRDIKQGSDSALQHKDWFFALLIAYMSKIKSIQFNDIVTHVGLITRGGKFSSSTAEGALISEAVDNGLDTRDLKTSFGDTPRHLWVLRSKKLGSNESVFSEHMQPVFEEIFKKYSIGSSLPHIVANATKRKEGTLERDNSISYNWSHITEIIKVFSKDNEQDAILSKFVVKHAPSLVKIHTKFSEFKSWWSGKPNYAFICSEFVSQVCQPDTVFSM